MHSSRPATDSSLTVPPQFWRDGGKSQQEWLDATDKFRVIRGNVIAEAYDIENKIGRVLVEVFYPTVPWHESHDPLLYESHQRLRATFEYLCVDKASFSERLNLLKAARRELTELREACSDELIAELNRVREIRNHFAHDPIQFRYSSPPDSQIQAFLVSRGTATEITNEYELQRWNLFIQCSSQLGDCLRALERRFDRFARRSP